MDKFHCILHHKKSNYLGSFHPLAAFSQGIDSQTSHRRNNP